MGRPTNRSNGRGAWPRAAELYRWAGNTIPISHLSIGDGDEDVMMTPAEFIHAYGQNTNTHSFANVAPLIATDAIYWFSDGSFQGLDQIQAAFEKTWNLIEDERYSIENVQWIAVSHDVAVGIYVFRWQGLINGHLKSGSGRGTSVLRRENERWVVAHEHLSPMPA